MRKTLEYLQDAFKKHNADMIAIYTDHKAKKKQINDMYKPDAAKKEIDRLIEYSRARIADIDNRLSLSIGVAVEKMRSKLNQYITAPVNSDLIRNLHALHDFGVKLNRTEIDAYARQATGNMTALRCLGVIAQSSGFKLNFCEASDLQADIDEFSRIARVPMMVAPLNAPLEDNLLHEALEVLPDRPFFDDEGHIIYSSGRPESTYVLMLSSLMSAKVENMPDIIDRWTRSIVPSIDEIVKTMSEGNDGKPDDSITEAAQKEHDAAVDAAADAVTVERTTTGNPSESAEERVERAQRILSQYK